MNKKEIATIKQGYRITYTNYILNSSNEEYSFKIMKNMLDNLGLKKERYEAENEVITEMKGYTTITKESFQMIIEDFAKYNVYVNYDLDKIDVAFEELQYIMTEEEIRCHNARINIITSKVA